MKLQIKFDTKALVGLIFEYGERVVFACVVLCFLFFVYTSFARERYDKSPQDLEKAAESARRAIENAEPEEKPEVKNYLATIEEISNPLDEEPYAIKKPFDPPIFPPRSKRGAPNLFTVENLRATPDMGRLDKSMAVMGPAAGVGGGPAGGFLQPSTQEIEPLGSRWVMLTGLVDLKKQTEAFLECYKDAVYKTQFDQAPQYYAFRVERAEVTDGDNPAELNWQQPYTDLEAELKKCGVWSAIGGSSGYVAANFIDPRLTLPLPKRLDEDWNESVAHLPEIPLMGFADGTTPPVEEAPTEERREDPDDPGSAFRNLGDRTTGMGARGAMGPDMDMMPGMGPGMGPGMRPGMRPGMEDGMMGRFAYAARGGQPMTGQAGEELSPYLLFRFIDFNVEPGKQYKYRVQLYFYNPNFNVPSRFLIPELQQLVEENKNPELRKKKWKNYIPAPWSEPSDAVAAPRDDQLLLASVEPAKRRDSDPEAKVMAVHWDMLNGIKISDEFENVSRGMVANFLDHQISLPQEQGRPGAMGPGHGGPMPPEGPAGKPAKKKPTPRKKKDDKKENVPGGYLHGELGAYGAAGGLLGNMPTMPEKVDFKTECLVLDIRGGERLEGKNRELTEPGEMLLLDPDGNIIVRSDVEDFDQYCKYKYPSQQSPSMPGRPGRMAPPGPGMDLLGM